MATFTEFNLQKNAYAAFDAVSMRQLLIDRLKASGLFPDIDYESSNISAFTDIIAYTYHVLLFYLNNTAAESLFSQAELYENMNKIVSLIGYKPQGKQTALMNFSFNTSSELPANFYTLKRYAYVNVNGVPYTFRNDIAFEKTVDTAEEITNIGENNILHQGIYREYPVYTAIGEEFEQLTLAIDAKNTDTTIFTDYNTVDVYVKNVDTNTWEQFTEIASLYFASAEQKAFEKRYNENGRIEIKFGNNVNGKQLKTGDIVAIYYIESMGNNGVLGANALSNANLTLYNTEQYIEIANDIYDASINYIDANTVTKISLDNLYSASVPTDSETVASIRKNAPFLYAAQNRAVTTSDYEAYINKNFSNIVSTVKVVSNSQYIDEYLKYFYEIGLERPNDDKNVMFNQIQFADACDFNNVWIFSISKLSPVINGTTPNSLQTALKNAIVNKLNTIKLISQEIVFGDPVYNAFSFGILDLNETPTIDIKDETTLVVTRQTNAILSKEQIKTQVYSKIVDFFAIENAELGQLMDFNKLTLELLEIPGVDNIQMVRGNVSIQKLGFVYWNPVYPADVRVTTQNLALPFYKFPFLYNSSDIINKIQVI